MPDPVLGLKMLGPARDVLVDAAAQGFDVTGVNALEPLVGPEADLLLGQAQDRFPARGIVDDPLRQVPVPQAIVRAGRRQRVARLAHAQGGLDLRALGDLGQQALVPRLQLARLLIDHAAQLGQLEVRLAGQAPLLRQRAGDLTDLGGVERLLQDQQPIAGAEPAQDVLPRIVGVRRADDDLDLGIGGPQVGDGLDAVPAGRHAHVDERDRVALAAPEAVAHLAQRLLPLVREVHVVPFAPHRRRLFPEERLLHLRQHLVLLAALQDLAKVLVDLRIVVDDQDPPVLGKGVRHAHGQGPRIVRRHLPHHRRWSPRPVVRRPARRGAASPRPSRFPGEAPARTSRRGRARRWCR